MSEILDGTIRLFEIFSACYGSIILKDYFDRRGRSKKEDVSNDFRRKREITEILERIRYELDADRVLFWLFSNGDTTLNGYHLKKLSIYADAFGADMESMAQDFQLVPSKHFERSLEMLHDSKEDYYLRNESDNKDQIAALADRYGIDTILSVKVRNEYGRWIGFISICFSEKKELSEGEIVFAKIQAATIGPLK